MDSWQKQCLEVMRQLECVEERLRENWLQLRNVREENERLRAQLRQAEERAGIAEHEVELWKRQQFEPHADMPASPSLPQSWWARMISVFGS